MGDKNLKLKVLGREFEGEPFFKRVSLNRERKSCCMSTTVITERFFVSCFFESFDLSGFFGLICYPHTSLICCCVCCDLSQYSGCCSQFAEQSEHHAFHAFHFLSSYCFNIMYGVFCHACNEYESKHLPCCSDCTYHRMKACSVKYC